MKGRRDINGVIAAMLIGIVLGIVVAAILTANLDIW